MSDGTTDRAISQTLEHHVGLIPGSSDWLRRLDAAVAILQSDVAALKCRSTACSDRLDIIAKRLTALEETGKEPVEGALKPCPFCGSNAVFEMGASAGFWVRCLACNCGIANFTSESEARDFWNRRWEK